MRNDEWVRAVRKPLATAAADTPTLVLVEGEAGTGKSTFIEWLLALPEHGTMPCLKLTFAASGAYALQHSARPSRRVPVVREARSVPARAGRQAPVALSPPPAPLSTALLAELAALRTYAGMLLVAEDIHWASEQDARVLRSMLAHPPAGLRAVLTYRPEELTNPGLALGAAVGYPAELNLVRLRLGALKQAEVRKMAAEALGENRCSAPFITRLHERSGGIAQTVADLLAELRARRPFADHDDALALSRDRLTAKDVDAAGVPVRLTELVVGRMARLSGEQQLVVWAAAVLDEAASEDELAAVAALPAEDARSAVTAALFAAVLCDAGSGRYGFRSPLEAAAAYRILPGPLRCELHNRAAEILALRRSVPWERLARHQLASGRIDDWLASVEAAAREAVAVGEHQLAVSVLEQALSYPEVLQADRMRLALLLARSAVIGLRSDQTVEVLRRVVKDRALPPATRGEIRLSLGLLLGNQLGRSGQGRLELVTAVEELRERPVLAARAMSALALPYWPVGPLAENLAWLEQAETTAAASGDTTIQAAVAANRVTVLLSIGDPDGWGALEQLPRHSDDPEILRHCARGLGNAADAAVWLGEYGRAGELLAEGTLLNAQGGGLYREQLSQGSLLHMDLFTGHWAGLAARARTLLADYGEMPILASDARLALGRLALAKGDLGRADTLLSGVGLAGDDAAVPLAAAASGARIRLALARQDPATAIREATQAWERLRRKAVWVWASELAPWAVEAAARAEQPETARKMVDEFTAGTEYRRSPAADAARLWCWARLAEAGGELAAAGDCFRRVRIAYQWLPRPYEAALAAESAGRCALGNPHDGAGAISDLEVAERELDALGASFDAARVRAQLRVHQGTGRRPPGRPSYGKHLSPREQEVAQLAAVGLTNREIAAALHLSPRTVEHHVARAIKKSGVLSRRDLAQLDGESSN